MNLRVAVRCLLALASAGSLLAQTQTVTRLEPTRSGQTILCRASLGCTEETIDGRRFYILETKNFEVKVAIDRDHKYNRADVTVTNHSGLDVHLTPADFRIEVLEPEFKRLSYIDPEKLKLPKVKPEKIAKAAAQPAGEMHGLALGAAAPAPSRAVMDEKKSGPPALLASAVLTSTASTTGSVYFERSDKAKTMSLLLPIAGAIFEFPYVPAK